MVRHHQSERNNVWIMCGDWNRKLICRWWAGRIRAGVQHTWKKDDTECPQARVVFVVLMRTVNNENIFFFFFFFYCGCFNSIALEYVEVQTITPPWYAVGPMGC